jgi:two-component system chemotaxis sensor kinase CheA
MDFDPNLMKLLIDMFQVELDESTQAITEGLLALEKSNLPETERTIIINNIFRAAHNIKGTARGIGSGITAVADIAHAIESLFSLVKDNKLTITANLINQCLNAVDKMRLAMQAFANNTDLSFDLAQLLKQLEQSDIEQPTIAASKPTTIAPAPTAPITPSKEDNNSQPLDVKTIHVSLNNLDKISALMEEVQANKIAITGNVYSINKLTDMLKRFNQLWKQTHASLKGHFGDTLGELYTRSYETNADILAEMNNIADQLHKDMDLQVYELTNLSNSLQDEIRTLRLIPANNLLHNFPRYVRDLALDLGKQVEFQIKGDDVKIDKMVLEGLKDPLIHLLRNALDHGIETTDVRTQQGKAAQAHVILSMKGEGDHITIQITDDGSGIDSHKVAAIALEKNIITAAELEGMDENSIIDLIFRPGFSTKTQITQISGRGVGLDVVRSMVDNFKGNIRVLTEVGKGTTFILQVPVSLASERGFLVNCSGQPFVISTSAIESVMVVSPEDIHNIEATQALLIDNHPIHLLTLADILHLEKHDASNQQQLPIIIIKNGRQKVALAVDEILGEREIVIKPLQPPLHSVPCVAGGTVSGSGQVIVVLNATDIVNAAFNIVQASRIELQTDNKKSAIKPHILVVDDSITTRTLEKSVLESNNYQVTTAVDGKEAWDLLQKQTFALLITDGMMPNMDGFTLTANVKNNARLKDLPVILVTSLNSPEEKKRGLDAGANYYIVKSEFESGALLDIVRQLL